MRMKKIDEKKSKEKSKRQTKDTRHIECGEKKISEAIEKVWKFLYSDNPEWNVAIGEFADHLYQELKIKNSRYGEKNCECDCECDCHMFIGGSGKPCPECLKSKRGSAVARPSEEKKK